MAEDVFGIVGTLAADQFRVERAVARLADGVVYRAEHGAFRAPVALKCFEFPGGVSADQRLDFTSRFRKEAEVSFRLSSAIPEIVRPLHVGGLADARGGFVPFIAYEWVDAKTLDEELASGGPLPLERAVRLLSGAARALARAHHFTGSAGVETHIHGDVRPPNIVVVRDATGESVRLRDFAVAQARQAASMHGKLTDDKAFAGGYAAPEQWRPQRFGTTGPWTDVWGLALTLVEALTGVPPIEGDNATMMGQALDNRRRPTPRTRGADVSPEIERAFADALAVDPGKRTGDVRAFWGALERALGMRSTFDDTKVMGLPAGSAGSDFPGATPEAAATAHLGSPPAPRGLGGLGGRSAAATLGSPSGELELDLPPPPKPTLPSERPPADAPSGLELGIELRAPPPPSGARGVVLHDPGAPPAPTSAAPEPPTSAAPPVPASAAPPVLVSAAPAAPGSEGGMGASSTLPSAHLGPPSSGGVASGLGPPSSGVGGPLSGPLPLAPDSRAHSIMTFLTGGDEPQDLKQRLRIPGALLAMAIVLTLIDIVVARVWNEQLAAGPITIKWLTIPLFLAGVGLGLFVVIKGVPDDED